MASGRAGTRTVPLSQGHPPRPTTRWDFDIAIICALPLEVDAVTALFDHHWEEDGPSYGRAVGDSNAYSTGAIGLHNVVLVHMRSMGKVEAATVATGCRSSFPNIRLAMVVGVCGAVPFTPAGQEIVLGDVIIGEGVVQYDFGRRLPERFIRKDTLQESLGRHRAEIGGQLARLKSERGQTTLERKMAGYLVAIQSKTHSAIQYPGTENDRLFQAAYRHVADGKLCNECGCDGPLVRRNRLEQDSTQPIVHIGLVASGDTVLKSGEDRDTVAQKEGVIGFEMEGAGVWDVFPCVVIKGVCDYADSHKMKAWQRYAAATAAACMKAFLESWPPSTSFSEPRPVPGPRAVPEPRPVSRHTDGPTPSQYHIPFLRNRKFTGRDAILKELQQKLFIEKECRNLAIVGLGGVGKTQLALQLAYWVKDNQPDYSIFWVPILSHASFEQAYLEIGKKLGIPMNGDEEDPKESVRRYLSSDKAGRWLLIIDNADDMETVLGSNDGTEGIDQYLPEGENDLTLFTTRSIEVGQSMAGSDVVELHEMDPSEAMGLLEKSLFRKQLIQDKTIAIELLQKLERLPLAITQAAAYLNCNRQVTVRRYLELLRGTERDMVELMSREFKDATRYRESRNAVATTWLVSFDQIQNIDDAAADLLSFLSCIEPKAIPRSLLPDTESAETENAIGTLCGYAFLAVREDEELYDMHSLVHLATKVWIRKAARTEETTVQALRHFEAIFPSSDRANRLVWQAYLPHAFRLLSGSEAYPVNERFDIFYGVGKCLYADRCFKDAVRCHEEVVRWKSDTLPDTDHDRLVSEHALAIAYLDDRRIPEAIKMFEHVVAVEKETLDERDHDRLASELMLARAYLDDRRIPEAIEMFEHVVAIRKETLDERDESRLDSELLLANAYLDDRKIPMAIKMLEHVVAVRKVTLDEGDKSRLTSEHTLARAYLNNRQIRKAIDMLEHVVMLQREMLDQTDNNRLASDQVLASAYLDDRRIPEAIEMLEHVVAIRKETLDERDYERLTSEHELARAYLDNRQITKAMELLKHVVAAQKETLEESDHFRLTSESTLAMAYIDNRQIRKAIKIFEHIVRVRKETLDETDHILVQSEHALAFAYLQDRRIHDAIRVFEHIVAVQKETLDERDHDRLTSEQQLAKAYLENRQIPKAIEMLEHVMGVRKETLDETDHRRLVSEHTLARAYLDNRRIPEAIKIMERVVGLEKETLDERDHSRLTSEHTLARAYLDHRQIRKAIEILEHVVAVRKGTLDVMDYHRLISEHTLARAYIDDRKIPEAIEILERVVAVQEESLYETDHSHLASKHQLARAYLSDRRIPEAIKIFEHVVAVRKETLDERDRSRLTSEHALASAYLSDRRIPEAIKLLEHVVAVEKDLLEEDDPNRMVSKDLLEEAYEIMSDGSSGSSS